MPLGRRQPALQIAPVHLRFVAALINLLLGVVALALSVGAAAGAFFVLRRTRIGRLWRILARPDERRSARLSDRHDLRTPEYPLAAKLRSPLVMLALELCSFAVAVRRDGRQSPGARVVGIRLADARTGGKPNRWQAVVRVSTRQAWQAATTELLPWSKVRALQEDEGFRSKLETAQRQYADDEEALQQALMRIYREHRVSPVHVSCLPVYVRLLLAVAINAPVLWTPLGQGLADKFAGTVVIVERRASRRTHLAARLR